MPVAYYPAIIERGLDGYGVFFPDLPGCTSAGDTIQAAARNAEDALQGHIEIAAEHGETVPQPTGLDDLAVDPDVIEAARVLIRTELPGRAVQVDITMPEDLLAAADRYAARAGYTRSGLVSQAVREMVGAVGFEPTTR